jgi:hypothetical protein
MRLTKPLAIAALLATPVQAQEAPLDMVQAHIGRFAVFADRASIRRDGDVAQMRALQVADADFRVGDQPYWGGWSRWRFDCGARTADRLDFAAVREGGAENPPFADDAPAYDAAPGGEAAALLDIACLHAWHTAAEADTVAEAVRLGRDALAD